MMMENIPKELLEYGGQGLLLVWLMIVFYEKINAHRNGGNADASERGIMLKSLVRNMEVVKNEVGKVLASQDLHAQTLDTITKEIGKMEDEHKNLWSHLERHDERIRQAEITLGGRR